MGRGCRLTIEGRGAELLQKLPSKQGEQSEKNSHLASEYLQVTIIQGRENLKSEELSQQTWNVQVPWEGYQR